MGIPFSCPGSDYDALDEGFETVIVRSISFNGDDVRTALQSVSFNGRDSEPTILKSLGSGKMIIEGSLSFKNREMEAMISIKAPSPDSFKNKEINSPILRTDSIIEKNPSLPMLDSGSPKHEAALKLQKVYKSFRTRRKLADCAVLVEQRWWKLLDFVELKRSSVSFFHIEKHESAISRWSRARTRVAKVGKGLSKDDKAQKLALQHWLEAIDPRHRYGHNLHFYYVTWLRCESVQPFFYWLDIGEGKEVNLVEKCPRLKLQQQCIKYLGPIERKAYEVLVEDGKFHYKQSGKLLDTSDGPKGAKWIFVLSTSKILYVGQKKKGRFQHSSFLAGGATSAAGRLVVENGMLKAVWPHSGHYRPTEQNFQEFVSYLNEHNVDLTNVKKSPTDDDDESSSKDGDSIGLRSNSSALDLTQEINNNLEAEDTNVEDLMIQERTNSASKGNTNTEPLTPKPKLSLRLNQILSNLEIPKKDNLFEIPNCSEIAAESPLGGYETAEDSLELEEDEDFMGPKRNLFEEDKEEDEEELVPKESILQRINSKKGMTSYQLGKQLSCKWTTGAGPRIGCVRDFPSELQFRALEQVNLSPRSAGTRNTTSLSPKVSTPSTLWRGTHSNTRTNFR